MPNFQDPGRKNVAEFVDPATAAAGRRGAPVTLLTGGRGGEVPDAVLAHVEQALREAGHAVTVVDARELPTVALLSAATDAPELAAALEAVTEAAALVVTAQVHRAAYSGLVQALLRLLPPDALVGKPVLPIAVGGAHGQVVALDYALRPLLGACGADRVLDGVFVDEHAAVDADGSLRAEPVAEIATATERLGTELAPRRRAARGKRAVAAGR